ncbi:beta-N-acetylglucosaminidase domain-containing protein [Microbacterium sp.]|uniref:beta-N-acetylhexosaminidase family protein n=1 Tax=Microbacterium sp. TaxID=51671 RepID=UPI0028118C15|nr:beta-N-acetylglucosaminidase domain-containing protein [Microbacterium sp.]
MRDDDTRTSALLPWPLTCDIRGGTSTPVRTAPGLREVGDPTLPSEGYRLEVRQGTATAYASGPRGFRHAWVTLDQLVTIHGGMVPDAVIDDAPVLSRRGIIEGFYGAPWSHEERLAALRLAGRLKLNSYVYAPKDDPFHRERWREPYPAEELSRLVELATHGAAHGVDVVVALHPAGSMVFSDDAEQERLITKATQLLDAGVPSVALLFDDVPPTPTNDADRQRFGDSGTGLGDAHALTIRRFRDALAERLAGGDLLVVPMDYAGTGTSEYREAFAAGLPDDVLVWWTGHDIVVGEVTRAHIDAAAQVFGDRLLLWDNFPVNDFDRGRAFLGPLLGRTADVAGSALHGAWSNPMVEYAAGGFGIAAFADWAWNPAAYEPQRAARAALRIVAGRQADRLGPLVRTLSSWPPSAPMDAELDDAAASALAGVGDRLRSRLTEWAELAEVSLDEQPARSLAPWIRAAIDMATAGLAALDVLDGRRGATVAEAALAAAEAHEAKVGTDVVPDFVRAVIDRHG